MVKVSVVFPVYNCMKYFQEAMESILKQTFKDFEVIIRDDGSNDGTEKVINTYTQMPNIKLINYPTNTGLTESVNEGIRKAVGEYIAIQHADDISLPSRLEKQVQYLDTHPDIELVASWVQYINRNGKNKRDDWWLKQAKSVPDDPILICDKLLEINCIFSPTVMFRKRIIDTVGFYDPDAWPAEDYDYWLRISEVHNIGMIQEVLYHYRQHPQQGTRTVNMKYIKTKATEAVQKAKKRRGL